MNMTDMNNMTKKTPECPWVVMLFHPHGPYRRHDDTPECTWVVMLFHPMCPQEDMKTPQNVPG